MVRGGSSPLGRTGKALHSGAFLCRTACSASVRHVDVLLPLANTPHWYVHLATRDGTAVRVRVSVQLPRGGWEVRWRDASGRRRARRFPPRTLHARSTKRSPRSRPPLAAARPPAAAAAAVSTRTGPPTGVRWRFVYRAATAPQTSKRGFVSERAARDARRRLIEQVERGEVRHTQRDLRRVLGALARTAQAISRGGDLGGLRDRRP